MARAREFKHGTQAQGEATSLDDEGLIQLLWKEAHEIPDPDVRDSMYVLVGEAVERWSPEAAWQVEERQQREADPGGADFELEATRRAWDERARARGKAQGEAEKTRAARIEEFIILDAIGDVLSALDGGFMGAGALLRGHEALAGALDPQAVAGVVSGSTFDQLWPGEDWPDGPEGPEFELATARAELMAGRLCSALAAHPDRLYDLAEAFTGSAQSRLTGLVRAGAVRVVDSADDEAA
jgi:hypothetical protein